MKCIKTKDDLSHLEDEAIKESISNHILTLEQQYDEPYQATLHGWFIICEDESDLSAPLPHLTFSLSDKLHLGEVEYVEKKQNWYEVYVLLQLVAQYDVPSHATTVEILLQIAQLSKVIGNLNDIHAIIEKKQFNTVMSVARAYKSNIVVHYFIKRFYRYNPERYLDNGFQLTPDDAADWLLKGFKQVQKDTAIPFKRVLKDKLVSGIKVDPKTKEVSINPSKAANFFAKHFSVNDRNAKKPASRYLEFTGIAYGNYQFLAIAKYQQPFLELPNEFKLGERTFNPFTGAVISGPDSPLEMIIHSDQPDYFDEGEIENKGEGLGQVA
ncbi:hypothetical protein BFR88_00810 [Acinetobacter pittii]|nr:hypothetical protein [Acinetobacter pittii]MCK0899010.1 hypothetical protein [Acinetobacter pittii]MCK0915278.1 hypothetical protein [Acinetobacter pittii]OCY75954.1 hypothetical protein BFR86_01725 [Acinetobacter pittii]OCY82777.1 hypothetical protein BFR87_03610 [Acinetobacter pittii]OCY83465.1 hypothetical protein BFR88_00810 [Acinetobacter pittii]